MKKTLTIIATLFALNMAAAEEGVYAPKHREVVNCGDWVQTGTGEQVRECASSKDGSPVSEAAKPVKAQTGCSKWTRRLIAGVWYDYRVCTTVVNGRPVLVTQKKKSAVQ